MSSVEMHLPSPPTTLLIGGEVAMRYQHALEGKGVPTGVVESGGEAVAALKAGGYQAVIVPAVLLDMSAYDFTVSLLRHMQGVRVVLYGAVTEERLKALVQAGQVAHLRGEDHEDLLVVLGGEPPSLTQEFGPAVTGRPASEEAPLATPPLRSGLFAQTPTTPFGGTAPPPDAELQRRVDELEGRLADQEVELEGGRARVEEVERQLGPLHAELESAREEARRLQATMERVEKERDGLHALIGSLEEERGRSEANAQQSLTEVEDEKAQLEFLVQDLERKLRGQSGGAAPAGKPGEPDAKVAGQLADLLDHCRALAPLTWELAEAADHLAGDPGAADHASTVRMVARSLEGLLGEARRLKLID